MYFNIFIAVVVLHLLYCDYVVGRYHLKLRFGFRRRPQKPLPVIMPSFEIRGKYKCNACDIHIKNKTAHARTQKHQKNVAEKRIA